MLGRSASLPPLTCPSPSALLSLQLQVSGHLIMHGLTVMVEIQAPRAQKLPII